MTPSVIILKIQNPEHLKINVLSFIVIVYRSQYQIFFQRKNLREFIK